ncbi:hypothetical protein [Microbacterium sp. No. 7]|uniref:hypothetical protein n=1 Tax=Microbacterium sp. No. 7 TaxID=1714373 RepID=UPI0006CF4F52|nr:hypothetical protein [Microbacterium sp. No. 7]ALJ22355.1 hypothetical protein AOA12_22195 [Microbacterium sp. No. 7]
MSSRDFSVDIVYLCSNNSATPVTATQLREISAAIGDFPREFKPRTQRRWNRLSDEDRATVAARYGAGETSTALAAEYGVAKSTILGILREKRTVVRRQPLAAEQVIEAVRLYASGLSLSQVADQLDVNQETMRMAVLKAGVVLRPPTGA